MRTFSTLSSLILTGLVALSSAGCLQKTTVTTVYIGPSDVTVSVMETDIRSDEKTAGERLGEEHAFVLQADAGQHSTAQDLRELGGRSVRTSWIRRERPYGLMTEARFADLRALAMSMIRAGETSGNSTIARHGCETAFEIWLTSDHAEDLGLNRLVLTDGHFTMADGFRLEDDATVALPDGTKRVAGVYPRGLWWFVHWCDRV
jgi:hypothetical protein